LQHASLAIHPREIITLIGPNGAGKTTLLKVLLGLMPATEGKVWRKHGLRLGYMPQKLAVDASLPLTPRGFLTLWGAPEAAAAEVGITHLLDHDLHSLSGGEFQRTLLARALIHQPELLVLDEPVQGVDVQGQTALYQLIEKIRDRLNCAVLLVSHDLHLVMAHSDRVICLNQHICCQGKPGDVSQSKEYQALFGPGVAVYHHHHDHHHD
jgi:zinc transport system ATP-binding protein